MKVILAFNTKIILTTHSAVHHNYIDNTLVIFQIVLGAFPFIRLLKYIFFSKYQSTFDLHGVKQD